MTFKPLTPTRLSVAPNTSATIQYQIKNQSNKTHALVMKSIPGISQVTSPGYCPSVFTLGYQQSCILNLSVSGNALTQNVTGGPVVCDKNNLLQCYQPTSGNSLFLLSGGSSSGDSGYTIGGLTSGLAGSLVLQNNDGDDLAVVTNGEFTFSHRLKAGATYSVTVLTQPSNQTCTVTNGSGTVANSNVNNIQVNCTYNTSNIVITGSPLALFTSYPNLSGISRSFTVTNTSLTTAAIGVTATLPVSWTDVTQNASGCAYIAPQNSCQLTITSGVFAHAAATVPVAGVNTNTVNTSIAVNRPWVTNRAVYALALDTLNNRIYLGGGIYFSGRKPWCRDPR